MVSPVLVRAEGALINLDNLKARRIKVEELSLELHDLFSLLFPRLDIARGK